MTSHHRDRQQTSLFFEFGSHAPGGFGKGAVTICEKTNNSDHLRKMITFEKLKDFVYLILTEVISVSQGPLSLTFDRHPEPDEILDLVKHRQNARENQLG